MVSVVYSDELKRYMEKKGLRHVYVDTYCAHS